MDPSLGLPLLCIRYYSYFIPMHAVPAVQDYMDPSRPPPGFFKNVKVMFDVRDVVSDVQGEPSWVQCWSVTGVFWMCMPGVCGCMSCHWLGAAG